MRRRHGALTQRGSKTIRAETLSAAHLSGRFINITNHLSHQSHELHCVLVLILQDKKKKIKSCLPLFLHL